ncbi:MAG: pilus assembly protein PilP [Nitrospirae bacterium]|nr:pilus assembly protein PilP [Nitrospirota bacterium]
MVAVFFIFASAQGCKKETPPVKNQAAKVEKAPKEVQPEVQAKETADTLKEGFVYEPKGRLDPFVPLIETAKKAKGKKGGGSQGTIESFDAGDFKLIGIAKKNEQMYGLLLAPDNKSYPAKEGTILGLHKGRVDKILPDKIIIIEYIKDFKGELKPRQVVLELRKGRL